VWSRSSCREIGSGVGFCKCGKYASAFTKANNIMADRSIIQVTKIDSDTEALSGRH
jgi:hypothetical protein